MGLNAEWRFARPYSLFLHGEWGKYAYGSPTVVAGLRRAVAPNWGFEAYLGHDHFGPLLGLGSMWRFGRNA